MNDLQLQQLLAAEDFAALTSELQSRLELCELTGDAELRRSALRDLSNVIVQIRAHRAHYAEQLRQVRAVRALGKSPNCDTAGLKRSAERIRPAKFSHQFVPIR